MFGHEMRRQPRFVISDQAWDFILVGLQEFECETLEQFIKELGY